MAKPKLTLALSHYDRHVPFFDGSVEAEGVVLNVLIVGQSDRQRDGEDRHERMLQKEEFDVAELSLSSYLMAKSRGMPFTAIPVFPRRLFSLSQMWVNVDSGINSPRDLIGKKVGLHSFQNTLATLAKGDLQNEYDVPWRQIHWMLSKEENVPFKPEAGLKLELIPKDKKVGDMLESGEIAAMMTPHPPKPVLRGSKKIRRLFTDPKAEDLRYFRKNGFFPIMHVVAFKNEILERYPDAARSLFAAFEQAKTLCREFYADPNWSWLAWGRQAFEEQQKLLGDDPWPYGLEKNRANLERFAGYSLDQGLMAQQIAVEDLFLPLN
ncbi:MAG TPA: ABC transporter substrate-binding protein [Candidatus Binatia bacterium]|nr:ABC transporter substrate-binding protein [Candidatus Binatia bacterium]